MQGQASPWRTTGEPVELGFFLSFPFNYFPSRQNPAGIDIIEFRMFQGILSGCSGSQSLLGSVGDLSPASSLPL